MSLALKAVSQEINPFPQCSFSTMKMVEAVSKFYSEVLLTRPTAAVINAFETGSELTAACDLLEEAKMSLQNAQRHPNYDRLKACLRVAFQIGVVVGAVLGALAVGVVSIQGIAILAFGAFSYMQIGKVVLHSCQVQYAKEGKKTVNWNKFWLAGLLCGANLILPLVEADTRIERRKTQVTEQNTQVLTLTEKYQAQLIESFKDQEFYKHTAPKILQLLEQVQVDSQKDAPKLEKAKLCFKQLLAAYEQAEIKKEGDKPLCVLSDYCWDQLMHDGVLKASQ